MPKNIVIIENIPDKFYREVRKIEVYDASEYPYAHSFLGEMLSVSPVAVFENIVPEDFDRSIKRKSKNNNTYFEIDMSFDIYDTKPINRRVWSALLNKKGFVVVIYSNLDYLVIGNASEPMYVETQDKIKDDNSGTDKLEVQIYGETILEPIAYPL